MIRSNRLLWALFTITLALIMCSAPPEPTASPPDTQAAPPAPTPTGIGPTATIVYYPIAEKAWDRIPTVVISAAANDPRIPLVQKAVNYWNEQFKAIGTPFHLGQVAQTTTLVPALDLKLFGNPDAPGSGPLPPDLLALMNKMPGDLVIVLSDETFVSFTKRIGGKKLIGIQAHPGGSDSPSITQNTIAHEMGHAIGLGHNNDPTTLMCGRPAPCRPGADQFLAKVLSTEGFAMLTDEEKAYLLKIYPPTWKPTH